MNPTLQTALEQLKAKLTPTTLAQLNTIIAFYFTDTTQDFTLAAQAGLIQGWLTGNPSQHGLEAKFKVSLTSADFAALVLGKLHPMAGMVTGRMKLEGNMREALALDRLLKSA